jgi:shikimate kinase
MTDQSAPGEREARRIVLVGFMGSGKTTTGLALARLLAWAFRDLDRVIEGRLGLSVAQIFSRHGEAFFRAEELRVAEDLAALDRCVIAAGGGAFAQPATRAALSRDATIVWLRCDLNTVLGRIHPNGSRPLAGSRERMARLLAEREPSYSLADLTVESAAAGPEETARRIAMAVRARKGGDGER